MILLLLLLSTVKDDVEIRVVTRFSVRTDRQSKSNSEHSPTDVRTCAPAIMIEIKSRGRFDRIEFSLLPSSRENPFTLLFYAIVCRERASKIEGTPSDEEVHILPTRPTAPPPGFHLIVLVKGAGEGISSLNFGV